MKPTLALSMIMKDGEATLERCLGSVRGIVDEIVIADTGSTDRSIEIAKRHGARVISIPWEDDFAKARNASLAEVHSDWVLVLDDDEVLDEGARSVMAGHLNAEHVMAYMVTIRNYIFDRDWRLWDRPSTENSSPPPFAAAYPAYLEHNNSRLFRHHPDIFFEGCVHETVTYRVGALGMKTEFAAFIIHHLGFAEDGSGMVARKAVYYRELGRKKLRSMPDHSPAYFELGLEEFQRFRNYEAAVQLFRRAAELDPRFGVGWYFYGKSLQELDRHREALEAFDRALEAGGRKENILEAQADAHYALGEMEEALELFRQVLQLAPGNTEIESKLALTEVRAGDSDKGMRHLQEAARKSKNPTAAYERMMAAFVWMGDLAGAADAAEEMIEASGAQPKLFLRAASLRARLHDRNRAAEMLRRGLAAFPKDEKLRQAAAELGIK